MKLLKFLQMLLTLVSICKSESDSHITVSKAQVVLVNNKTNEEGRENEHVKQFNDPNRNEIGLNFDYDEDDELLTPELKKSETTEKEMQEILLNAMKKPLIRKQIAEVIPILRVMSPAQRLTLAALVSSQILSQKPSSETNLSELASVFAGKNLESFSEKQNVTEYLLLPISLDIAKMFRGLGKEVGRNLKENSYKNEMIDQNMRRFKRRHPTWPNKFSSQTAKRRKDDVEYYVFEEDDQSSKPLVHPKLNEKPKNEECDYFTKSLCLEVSNYPTEAIISSLRKNAEIAKTFLTDFVIPPEENYNKNKGSKISGRNSKDFERREDNNKKEIFGSEVETSYMCPSAVKYARPKRARTTNGHWKYIVNAGDYTQTLRLEICTKPKEPCSFVTNHLNSECEQVFNYHRLLTWDENKGLHMDMFKVPSCCSCHIQGYSNFFPPDTKLTFAEKRKEPITTSESSSVVHQEGSILLELTNNRKVPNSVPIENFQTLLYDTQVSNQPRLKEYPSNPVEHLVPPGPPLPLENERFNQAHESRYYHKKGPLETNVRYPAENLQTTNRATEKIEIINPVANLVSLSQAHLKSSAFQQKPNSAISPTIVPRFESNKFLEQNGNLHYVIPLSNIPLLSLNGNVRNIETNTSELFRTGNNQKIIQSGTKTLTRQIPRYHVRKYNDNKIVSSKLNPTYVTPPKQFTKGVPQLKASTPKIVETISANGQKKVNYNYHPIIDFFKTDAAKKKQKTFSNTQSVPLSSQDWTPVIRQ